MAPRASAIQGNQPFRIDSTEYGGHIFNMQGYDDTADAVLRFENLLLEAWTTSEPKRTTIDVRGGLMDFRRPMDGVSTVKSWLQLGNNVGGNELVYRIGPGATNRFSTADLAMSAPQKGYIVVDGGLLEVDGLLALNGNNTLCKEFVITNGGVVTANQLFLGNVTGGSRWRVDVVNGSTLAAAGTFKQCSFTGSLFDINIGAHSRLILSKQDQTYFGNVEGATLNVNLFDGGTLLVTNDFDFTMKNQTRPVNGGAFLNVSNGTLRIAPTGIFRMAQNLYGTHNFTIRNEGKLFIGHSRPDGDLTTWDLSSAHFDFTDDSVLYIGCYGNDGAHVIITNGTNTIRGKEFVLGKDGSPNSALTIGGNADITFGPITDKAVFNHLDRGDGTTFNLIGGRTTWLEKPTFGSKNVGRLTVNVTGGVHAFNTAVSIGYFGLCDWFQSGGDVTVKDSLTVGNWPGFPEAHRPQYFRLTGGSLTTLENLVVADGGNRAAIVELNGGILKAKRVYGWNGATVRKPDAGGLAILHGDGGTLEALSAQNAFMVFLDEAKVGTTGLVIRTDFDITLCAPWADLDGAEGEGRLILCGPGKKTFVKNLVDANLTCSNGALTNGITVCAGGLVHFADELPITTKLVVTNNAMVSFAGTSTGATLKGLVLGDATSGGTLRLDPGDHFTVDGPVSFLNAALEFTSPPEPADYVFLTVSQGVPVDAATKTAWEQMLIAAGHGKGKTYSFSVTEDESGNQIFGLKVETAEPLADTTTWQGPGTAWETNENWSAMSPGSHAVAVFSSDTAPAAVTLDTPVTIGALCFTNAGTSIGGAGGIGFTDSGYAEVSAEAGLHEIGVGLLPTFELPFALAEGSRVRIAGPITGGAINKTGEGILALANENNSLRGAIRIDGGAVVAESIATLGMRNGGANKVTLKKGVFAISNDVADATLPQTFELDAGAKTSAVMRVDEDLTVSAFSCASGNLVKRGRGRLTLAYGTGTVHLARDDGYSARSFSVNEIVYKENGSVPDDLTGFSGINVIEGELVLKGTAGKPEDTIFWLHNVDWRIGQNTATVADPIFTLDHAKLYNSDSHCALGYGVNVTGGTKTASLNLRNGAWFYGNSIFSGSNASGMTGAPEDDVYCRIHVSGASTLETEYILLLSSAHKGWGEHLFEEGSEVLARLGVGVEVRYPVRATWDDGSILAATRNNGVYTPTRLNVKDGGRGSFTFQNGSTLYANLFTHNCNAAFAFVFDDGTWDACGDMDFCFRYASKVSIETTGKGLTLPPADKQTYRMAAKISGTGGVVKTGAGTLAFVPHETLDAATGTTPEPLVDDPVTWDFDGTLDIREGVVTVANGCTRSGLLPVKVASEAELRLASGSDVTLSMDLGYSEDAPMPESLLGKTVALPITYDGDAPTKLADWEVGPVGIPQTTVRLLAENGGIFLLVERDVGFRLILK
ncbi:MAG TPA: hypothetical protein P5125_03600 [Kiritimatiellia bacterium]|nr:hypothetical protein [Kiritimatiellia bacterium]HOR98528.1 hypothetical protein [Kiritimatiellia bacterium]HPC48537.1 hypothetical protein [Kiritimatiellia bacterium]HRU19420.1 hypothetical protein [Kiritimatiellia bacterium]